VINEIIPPLSSLIKKGVSDKELDAILNLFPAALLLLDSKQNVIVSSNLETIELTGFTKEKIRSTPFFALFPLLPPQINLSTITDLKTKLKKKNSLQEVSLKFHQISKTRPLVLVIMETAEELHQKEVENSLVTQRWEALFSLSMVSQQENLSSAIKQALQAGQILTGTSFLALYLPTPGDNHLKIEHKRGNIDFLPETIKQSEISHLRIPYIWQIGTRSTSILHQKALTENLTYLATCPLNHNAPTDGTLVVGDQIGQPPEDLTNLLQVITGTLLSCISHYQQLDSVHSKEIGISNLLNITDIIKNVIADGLILTDEEHNIIDVNNPAAITVGYTQEELIGKSIDQILVSNINIKDILSSISREEATANEIGEVTINRRDGQQMLTDIRVVPLPENFRSASSAIILSDLSIREQYRTRAKQLESQAVLGEMMAIFAHEVRNPLNNIGMGLEVLSTKFSEKDNIQEEISRLRGDIDKLEDLMKSVLSVSRREYKMGPVNVKAIVENLIYRWKARMSRYNITATINAPDSPPAIRGDHRALDQVFTNIIQNAMNAMKSSGGNLTARIGTDKATTPKFVHIDIIDSGPGIPTEVLERIFDPFFTTNKDGNGLGLAITKQIVNAHNGQITVNSVPGGTVFRISLPIIQDIIE